MIGIELSFIGLGLISVLLFISAPLTLHNRLTLFSQAIIPLSRPFLSSPNKVVKFEDIRKINYDEMKNSNHKIFEFEIYDHNGVKYKINSLVLSRYDSKSRSAKVIRDALLNLKRTLE